MKIYRIFILGLVACSALLFGACNDEDDIDIFIGRIWKIGNLYDVQGNPLNDEEGKVLASKDNTFYIKFDHNGLFTGRTLDKNFSGTWSVDLKDRHISMRFTDTGNPTDALSKRVIERIKQISAYEGDYRYLKLKEKESSAYILCRPL